MSSAAGEAVVFPTCLVQQLRPELAGTCEALVAAADGVAPRTAHTVRTRDGDATRPHDFGAALGRTGRGVHRAPENLGGQAFEIACTTHDFVVE